MGVCEEDATEASVSNPPFTEAAMPTANCPLAMDEDRADKVWEGPAIGGEGLRWGTK